MAVVAHETRSHPHKNHKNYFAVITFSISLLLLILGYVFYGRFVERVPSDTGHAESRRR